MESDASPFSIGRDKAEVTDVPSSRSEIFADGRPAVSSSIEVESDDRDDEDVAESSLVEKDDDEITSSSPLNLFDSSLLPSFFRLATSAEPLEESSLAGRFPPDSTALPISWKSLESIAYSISQDFRMDWMERIREHVFTTAIENRPSSLHQKTTTGHEAGVNEVWIAEHSHARISDDQRASYTQQEKSSTDWK